MAQPNEKTVSNREFTFYQVVTAYDPDLEYERHHAISYDYAQSGQRARNFYHDPTTSGAYGPRGDFDAGDFDSDDFFTDDSPPLVP